MSLGADIIRSMGGKPYQVTRSGGGEYVKGEWVEIAQQTLQIVASIQPLSGREIERLPEGDRIRESKKGYFVEAVRPSSEITGAAADLVLIEGKQFQVYNVEPWPHYWKALLVATPRKE